MHPANVPDLRARELLTVVALAEHGSFVAAASHLKTSQPALTRAIKRVEKLLGVTPFARSTRQVEITSEGREFAAVAERVLKDLQITIRALGDLSKDLRGRITFTTYSAFAVGKLPSIVRQYREMLPLMELRIREGRQVDIVEDVRSVAITGKESDAGMIEIAVTDNGRGIAADDLALAFAPHATSKLATVADLEHVASLGFRGEALPAICSVSHLELETAPAGAAVGAAVEDREGRLGAVAPAAASPGARLTTSNAATTRPTAKTAAAITISIVRVLSPNAALQGAARSDASWVMRRQIESRPDVRSEGSSMDWRPTVRPPRQ